MDLAGRWTSQRHGYVLDITRCGGDWCGVKLNTDQTCGPLAMRLTNGASATERQGLVGTLALEPAVSTYKVRAHPKPADAVRPTEIHLLGNPDELPQPITRLIQFSDTLARGPEPMCKAEGKLS